MPSAAERQQFTTNPRYFEQGTALARVLDEAAYYCRCSSDKTATLTRPRDLALKHPYMQVNRPDWTSWLIFDLDHANAFAWSDAGLPPPNLIVSNRASGHSHLFYAIEPVFTGTAARPKPIQYMKAIREAYALQLDADPDYHSGPVAKTPAHPFWRTTELHNRVYSLGELADYVSLTSAPPWARTVNLDKVANSRHCILFERLRHFAYAAVRKEKEQGSFASFKAVLEHYAASINDFSGFGFTDAKLAQSSLRATVKSVSRWTWDKYTGSGRCNRGVMGLAGQEMELDEKQRAAAIRTHEQRHQTTANKVRAAIRFLMQAGRAITFTNIASAASITRQTASKYREIIAEILSPTPQKTETQQTQTDTQNNVRRVDFQRPPAGGVNYGAYQVTGPAGQSPLIAGSSIDLSATSNMPPAFDDS